MILMQLSTTQHSISVTQRSMSVPLTAHRSAAYQRTEMAVMPPFAGHVPAQGPFVASHTSQMVFDWL